MTEAAEIRSEERRRSMWKELWPALAAAGASIAFHAVHMLAVLATAGASSLAHAHHAHHAHHASGGAGDGAAAWLAWLGWGINGVTLLLAGHLLFSYFRHRKADRRKAASHLVVCLVSFAIVFVTIGISLS
ncbi:hypothetical protein MO973_12225 [Paenibacillus sp. TRM 82003]|nr:hypothetical protein [Paenibacillus sp. TRM 82003]